MKFATFARFLGDHLIYCVLHGWQSLPESPPSDLDIAIAPNDLEKVEATFARTAYVRVMHLIQYEATGYCFVLATRQAGALCFGNLDVALDYRSDGRVFFTATDLVRYSRKVNDFRVAAPEVEFAYLLVKKISKGALPEHQRMRMHQLYELLGGEARGIVHRMLGRRSGDQVIGWLARSEWMALETRLTRLKRALRFEIIKRDPFNAVRYWGPEFLRRWRRWRQPTGLCVALLGPDGSGKSTLIENLQKNLGRAAFQRVSVFHLRARSEHRIVQNNAVTDPHRRPPYPPWLSLLKVSYYVLCNLVGHMFIVRPRLVRRALVLFDRYYDDLLVDPRRYRYGASMRFARFASYFVQRPDLYFVLDAAEDRIIHRKREVTREELGRQREAYRRLASELPNAVMLDGSLPADEVAQSANDVIADYLHERYLHRRHLWFAGDDPKKTLKWLTTVLCSCPDDAHFEFHRDPQDDLGSGSPPERKFGWLSVRGGRAYLIPLEAGRAGIRALDLYNAQNRKARFAKALFASGLRLGIERRLMPPVHLIARRELRARERGHVHIFEYIEDALRHENLHFAISAGTPGPERKPVLMVLDGKGETLAYVKVSSSRIPDALVQRETEMLQFLANRRCRSFCAPVVLHSGCWNGHHLIIQSAPKQGTKAAVGDRSRYLNIPKELAALHTRWMPLGESTFWENILLRIPKVPNRYYRDTLARAVRKAEDWLKGERLPFHLSHGDFASWNTSDDGQKIYVFDWECSREADLPAQDIFHFHFQEMRWLERRDIERIYAAFLKDGAVRTRVETHLGCLGLRGVPVEVLFILYRLDRLATDAAGARGVPLFREFAMLGRLLNEA
jgi:thymidylate kinase